MLPQLFLAIATNLLDRTALSFAALQMNADLHLSTQQYGLAAATFALGEANKGVGLPLMTQLSNSCQWQRAPHMCNPARPAVHCAASMSGHALSLAPACCFVRALHTGYGIGHIPPAYLGMKLGTQLWLGVCTISWGCVAMFAAMVQSAQGLYWQRAALGLAGA